MSLTNVKLGDDAIHVPRLQLGGSNWVLYKDHLLWAADAKRILGQLDGTATEPRKGEANVKQLIARTIPDSLFMKIPRKPTVREIWTALEQEFERKSRMVSVGLR
ncbi:hypothetical protein BD414DRAFT_516911 [Trametes punicea]|nr:hypothetical protein BD414DRAFT_516911 [Trametes punicea]